MELLKENKTLQEMMFGSFVFSLIIEIVLLIFFDNRLYHSIGMLVGFLVSLALAYNMADTIDIAVDLDEKSAKAFLQKKSSLRYLAVCVAIIVLGVSNMGNPLTCFAGVMGLKIGAYLQPFTHKLFNPNEVKPVYPEEPVKNNEEGGEEVDE